MSQMSFRSSFHSTTFSISVVKTAKSSTVWREFVGEQLFGMKVKSWYFFGKSSHGQWCILTYKIDFSFHFIVQMCIIYILIITMQKCTLKIINTLHNKVYCNHCNMCKNMILLAQLWNCCITILHTILYILHTVMILYK